MSSLRSLSIDSTNEGLENFIKFKFITKIELSNVKLPNELNFVMGSVRSLKLIDVIGDFCGKFPSTEELEVRECSTLFKHNHFESFIKLRFVTIRECTFPIFIRPANVEIVTFEFIEKFPFEPLNFDIQELNLSYCDEIEWLMRMLSENRNLKSLKIESCSLTKELKFAIESNFFVKNLILNNCKVMEEEIEEEEME
jgi:hypothetical protein